MKDWAPVLRLARPALWTLGVVALACMAVLIAVGYWVSTSKASLSQVQRTTQTQRVTLQLRTDDLTYLEANKPRFDALRAVGLLGEPQRTRWIEQLQTSYQTLDLGDSLTYQLSTPKAMGKSGIKVAPNTPASGAQAVEFFAHDLQFEMSEVHEVDVLHLLADLQSEFAGQYRVNACKLQDPMDKGFTAQCVLRFFTIPSGVAPGAKASGG